MINSEDSTTINYGTLNGETREWFLLDWKQLPDGVMWHQTEDQNVRYTIINTRGVSQLRRLTGFGDKLLIERVSEKDEPYVSRETFCSFERDILVNQTINTNTEN